MTKKVRDQVYEKYNGHCAYCGCEITEKEMQVDHIIPKRKGGADNIKNYNPACRMCNLYKSTFNTDMFRERILFTMLKNLKQTFNYRMALKYGLIEERDIRRVKFYYENFDAPRG